MTLRTAAPAKRQPARRRASRRLEAATYLPPHRPLSITRASCATPLLFAMQHQQQTRWCWAAVAVAVNLYYSPASRWTQCSLANAALRQTTCCADGTSTPCNQPWYLDKALQIVNNLALSVAGKAALGSVGSEIDGCRPLGLRIGWHGGGGHFVAIYGCADTSINIADPWYGNSIQNYNLFPTSYHGGGMWTRTYYTRA